MTGLLSSQGFCSGLNRVGKSLQRVHPGYHQRRQTLTHRQTNPIPYIARYYGEKLHIDQSEKLGRLWCHTCMCYRWVFWENHVTHLHAHQEQCGDL